MADTQSQTRHAPKRHHVHKFGGSSLNNAEAIETVIHCIENKALPGDFIVVSANGHVTDWLFSYINGEASALSQIHDKLSGLISASLKAPEELLKQLNDDIEDIRNLNHIDNANCILAYGELWSAQLLTACLIEQGLEADWLDARHLFRINEADHSFDHHRLCNGLAHTLSKGTAYHVITGYIATNQRGKTITLGRNGSDYTATLLAEALRSPRVHLWTDVEGVFSADPNALPEAQPITQLSLCEAQALSELGSNVLHQKTMAPLLNNHTEIRIRKTSKTPETGTTITKGKVAEKQVKTLASKHDLYAYCIPYISEWQAKKFQTALVAAHIYSYANRFDKTQHELHFHVASDDAFTINQLAKQHNLQIQLVAKNQSLISAVGQNIRQSHEILNTLISRAANHKGTTLHYPANEHTLCLLAPRNKADALLRELHQSFFGLPPSLPIIILGHGNIGKSFIELLNREKDRLESQLKQSLRIVALSNSRTHISDIKGLSLTDLKLDAIAKHDLYHDLEPLQGHPAVVLDLTASESLAQDYPQWAEWGWHIISANKVAAANPDLAEHIKSIQSQHNTLWLNNTTAGAALPIQSTIRSLKDSGDDITEISGVFSGSLSWLLQSYDGSDFCDWVKQAKEAGFTEPDPRDDLSGEDVHRKAKILAQEAGFFAKTTAFSPLLPACHFQGDESQFWAQSEAINTHMKTLWQQANENNQSLCYLAKVTPKGIQVGLEAVAKDHPAANLKPSDNIFIIHSKNYASNPLVIQGPGAGREVTSAGVLTDLVQVLKH